MISSGLPAWMLAVCCGPLNATLHGILMLFHFGHKLVNLHESSYLKNNVSVVLPAEGFEVNFRSL